MLSVAEKTIYNYETGKTPVTLEFLYKVSSVFHIDYDYLVHKPESISQSLESISEVHKSKFGVHKSSISHVPYSQNIVPKSSHSDSLVSLSQNNLIDTLANRSQFAELDKYDIINIPFFRDGKVSAGFGEHHIEGDVDYIPYSKSMLKARFNLAPQGILGIIAAIGNSMAPTINDGDLLLFQCDGSSNDGGIYIMRLDNDYYVKRLQKRPKIRLISDNPTYEPIELQDLQELEIMGRVVGIISSVRL